MKPTIARLVVALLFAAALPAVAQVPFGFSASLTNGTFVRSVTAVDINGDGKPDLVSVRGNPSFLYTWTNNGNGIFVSNASYAVGSFPYHVIGADINGDTKPDLITANNSGHSLTVLTNDGTGRFVLSATLAYGSGYAPHGVAAGDLFNHSCLDLVSANSQNASFTVWSNTGSGIFVSNVTLSAGTPQQAVPETVAIADINGDGKPDIIGGCDNSDVFYLHVWTNNAPGGFVAMAVPNFFLGGIVDLVTADVNRDGKLDVVFAGSKSLQTGVIVLTNTGTSSFGFSSAGLPGISPFAIVAGDFNGDGYIDAATPNQANNTMSVLTNNGSGALSSNVTVTVGSGPESITAADVNGDGRLDLISGNWNSPGTMTVVTNAVLPALTITRAGAQTIVSWPAGWANWTLQQNTNLTTATWAPFSGVIGNDGFTKWATNSAPPNTLLFRLSNP